MGVLFLKLECFLFFLQFQALIKYDISTLIKNVF